MSGLSDFTAKLQLGFITGQAPFPTVPAVFLALMTAVDTDGGTGGTEVTGSGYARVQVAGSLAISGSTSTGSSAVTLASTAPAWLTALGTNGSGVTVYSSAGVFIGTVASVSGTAVTLAGNAAAVASGSLFFSAFGQPTGSAPSSITNGASITFPQATASWGTIVAFELRDANVSGNLLAWDYMGGFPWMPATVSAASPGVITAHAHGISTGGSFVFSTEYGGAAPTFSAGNYNGLLTAAGVTTDTLNVTGVNTSATGNGAIRQVTQQPIAINVTASFAASTLTITSA